MSSELEKQVEEIHRALVGNEEMGQKGLVKRVDDLEEGQRKQDKKIDTQNQKLIFASGFGAGAALFVKYIMSKIF